MTEKAKANGENKDGAKPRPSPPRRSWKARLRRLVRNLTIVGLLLAIAAGAAAWWAWQRVDEPWAGFRGERDFSVGAGESGISIVNRLAREGIIRDPLLARVWLRLQGNPPLQAGEYRFRSPLSIPQALGKLIRGDVVAHRITIVEGLTLEETAEQLASHGFGDRERLLAAMRDPSPIADLDASASDLEGYLFPDSYTFAKDVSEAQVVQAMVSNFRRRWRAEVEGKLPPDGGGRSVRQLVTLASIVEKEAKAASERPTIAAVYANRLRIGMGLYADPTVIFALKKAGRWDGNIRKADLDLDSPYNTYRNAGLPPGPICSPGVGSLVAAAAPADVPYLYFVARNDGTHVFSVTLDEHNRNVRTWQKRPRKAAPAPTR